jgi:hypothetical protein
MSETEAPHRLVNGVRVPLTAAEIAERAAEEAAYIAPPARWEVPKLLVIERLRAAGRLRVAYMALQREAPIADLTDDELALRERWDAASVLYSDDADVITFLTAIGADAATVLARP